MKVVVITRNQNWREFILDIPECEIVTMEGADGTFSSDGSSANDPDIILLDLDISEVGYAPELSSHTRKRFGWWPYLIATSPSYRLNRDALLSAVNSGADDFLEESYDTNIIRAKLSAFRRRHYFEMKHFRRGINYTAYIKSRVVEVGGEPVQLSEKEFELFNFLFSKTDAVFDRETIYRNVWGRGDAYSTRTLDTHISRLRRRLQLDGSYGLRLKPVYGVGYMMERVMGSTVSQTQMTGNMLPQA